MCVLCSLWSWGSIWTACFWTCVMMLRWVEFRCARCWTSAANTLGIPLVTPPSPTSENWSAWYSEAYPRYVSLSFDVDQLEHSWTFFSCPSRFNYRQWRLCWQLCYYCSYVVIFLPSVFHSVFHPNSLFYFIFPSAYLILFLAGWSADWQGVSTRTQ